MGVGEIDHDHVTCPKGPFPGSGHVRGHHPGEPDDRCRYCGVELTAENYRVAQGGPR